MGNKGIPGLGLGKSEVVAWDARRVHRKTYCLVRVGVGKSDGGHESNPSYQTIKVPSVCRITAVLGDGHRRMRQGSAKPQCHVEGYAGTPG